MASIFLLASDLGPSGAARRLAILAANLPRDRFRVEVGVLGTVAGPVADAIREAGGPVRSLPVRHALDVGGIRKLRRAVAAGTPAVVHAWGPLAARAGRPAGPRVVASAAAEPGGGLGGWLTARRLRRA